MKKIVLLLMSIIFMASCGPKATYDPFNISSNNDSVATYSKSFDVDFKRTESNIKTIHVKLNDAVSYDAIFDTGCSGMLISQLEFVNLLKAGTIRQNDYLDNVYSTYADGSTVENIRYNIHEVAVTDKNGQEHVISNVAVTIVENMDATVLVGSAIIDNLATRSYTVDLENNVIRFQ